jgi:SAM-dependent methyltransferase
MNQPKVHFRNACRLCGSTSLQRFLHLPEMPFTDDFITPEALGSEFRADINIFICTSCLSAQTQHDVDVGDYYEDYQYSVGGSSTASRFMRILAENTVARFPASSASRKVLEVGSGDGEQLVAFKNTGCRVLGYEPSSVLCKVAEAKGIPTIQGLFTADSIHQLPDEFKEVDVVMLSYTFDHLPDPRAFTAAARAILNKDHGLLIVEIHNLEKIIERQEYCLFEHEHSIYLTETSVAKLCALEGLTVIDFDLVPEADRRANSLIFVATPNESKLAARAVTPSTPDAFNHLDHYSLIGANITSAIQNLDRFVDQMTANGKTLAGYGAGGRGVMTLAAMRSAPKLKYLVDKKPKRPGLVAPKSGVPLVSLDELASNPVDAILVFSFGYIDEIRREVSALGYQPDQFYSLLDVLAGRF